MKQRVRVFGTNALVILISGTQGNADTGLFLHGPEQCFDLADALIAAGERIIKNEKNTPVPPGPTFFGRGRPPKQ